MTVGVDEFYAGQPVDLTMNFTNAVGVATDPSSGTLTIVSGYGANATTINIDFAVWVQLGVGAWQYEYDTTSLATATTGPVEVVAQVKTGSGLRSRSEPTRFTVLPPVAGT
jgi:hypothetical protein